MLKSRISKILFLIVCFIALVVIYQIFFAPNPSTWAAYSSNDLWVVTSNSVSEDGYVLNIWNAQDGRYVAQLYRNDYPSQAFFSPDNRFLINFSPNHDSGINIYRTEDWEFIKGVSYPAIIRDAAISLDVIYLLVCGYGRCVVFDEVTSIEDSRVGTSFETIYRDSGESYIATNPLGTSLFVALSSDNTSTIEIYEIGSYIVLNTIQLDIGITAIDWLDDERLIAVDTSNRLLLLDPLTSEQISSSTTPFSISAIDLNPDGNLLLAAGELGTILYNVSDMQQLAIFEPDSVVSARFNSAGTAILIASSSIRQPYLEIDISNFVSEQE